MHKYLYSPQLYYSSAFAVKTHNLSVTVEAVGVKMSLTVKAYYQKDGTSEPEIRRFNIPTDVSSSYDYLEKKIAAIFPSLREGHFCVHWKGIVALFIMPLVLTFLAHLSMHLSMKCA